MYRVGNMPVWARLIWHDSRGRCAQHMQDSIWKLTLHKLKHGNEQEAASERWLPEFVQNPHYRGHVAHAWYANTS